MNIEQLAESYKVNQDGIDVVQGSKVVFIAGITAAGKDSVINKILEKPEYYRIISHTTRKPRMNNGVLEKNGVDYYFVSDSQMMQLLIDHKMVEVNNFGGNYYGTSIEEIARAKLQNKIGITDIDINGIKSFYNIAPNGMTAFFVIPPDYKTWLGRVEKRYLSKISDFAQIWQTRCGIAMNELESALITPYYHFVINNNLEVAVATVDGIVQGNSNNDNNFAKLKAQEILDAIRQAV